jgi:EmrB/QacA subfamily drug resistance transporter
VTQASVAPVDHGHRHLGLALTLICGAQLMVVLDATIVNIALPYLQPDLGFSNANLSWVVTAYTLAFGGLLLLGGRLGDLFGRRRVFMFGVVLFGVASLLGGIAQSDTQLIAARVLQGIGAAAASPTALSLITTTFPAGPPRNRAFAVYAAMSGAGAAIGLILGGALTEVSWRLTLLINLPIGLLIAYLAPRVLGESERQRGEFDLMGAVLATAGLVSLVYGLTHAAPHGGLDTSHWGEPLTIVTLTAGVVLLAAFLAVESRATHALLPFRVLANRTRAVSFLVMLIVGASMFAMFFFLSLFIHNTLGYSSMRTGVAFLPFTVGIVLSAQTASSLVARMDPRWISAPGAALGALGMWGFSRLDNHVTLSPQGVLNIDVSYWTDLLPWILVLSFGLGLTFVPMTLTAVHGVAREDSGVGSAVLNTMQQIGGSIGLAALSTISVSAATGKGRELAQQFGSVLAHLAPGSPQAQGLQAQLQGQAITSGQAEAFLVAGAMMLVAGLIVLFGLNIKYEDLATEEQPEAVAVG